MSEQQPTEQELDDFVRGYVEAALWSSSIEEDFVASWNERYPRDDFASDTSCMDFGFTADDVSNPERAREHCADFMAANLADLRAYADACKSGDRVSYDSSEGPPMSYAGHDFWLTRNGHGAGFWDRGLGELGDRLTEASKPYAEEYLWPISDDQVAFEGG